MKVLYFSSMIESEQFKNIRNEENIGYGLQQQKFHECFVDGLKKNGICTEVISHFQINRETSKKHLFKIEKKEDGLIRYAKTSTMNIPILGPLFSLVNMVISGVFLAKKKDILIADYMNVVALTSAYIVARLCRLDLYIIVTDLTYNFLDDRKPKGTEKLQYAILRKVKGNILISKDIAEIEEFKNVPYVVYEGACNKVYTQSESIKNKTAVFTGYVDEYNGVYQIVNAWKQIKTQYILEIFGKCDDEKLKQLMQEVPNVNYYGAVDNAVCVEHQEKAMVLLNPRLLKNVYNRFSFPSKMIEYLASKTAVISTPIACLSTNLEYDDKMIFTEGDSADSWIEILNEVLEDKVLLENYANKAYDFMLMQKNTKVQVEKVINFIKEQM